MLNWLQTALRGSSNSASRCQPQSGATSEPRADELADSGARGSTEAADYAGGVQYTERGLAAAAARRQPDSSALAPNSNSQAEADSQQDAAAGHSAIAPSAQIRSLSAAGSGAMAEPAAAAVEAPTAPAAAATVEPAAEVPAGPSGAASPAADQDAAAAIRPTAGGRVIPTHKLCPRCLQKKPQSEYYRNRANCDGLASYCTSCQNTVAALSKSKTRSKNLQTGVRVFRIYCSLLAL